MNGRRAFLKAGLAGAIGHSLSRNAFAQPQSPRHLPRPNPGLFESGDFVWPKRPGAYVPYNSGSGNSPSKDRDLWLEERDKYLRIFSSISRPDPVTQERVEALRSMDYREFIAVYAGDQQPGIPGVYAGGALYVGHVAIVEVDSNKTPWVIEALLHNGVVRRTYADWITQRSEDVIWLGRLRQLDARDRAKVALEAKKHLNRPYDFWNFDLNDESVFYCSKLAWLSIYRSLGFAVDGIEQPKRSLWFSPKQFLNVPTIQKLHDPGPYAFA